MGEHRRTRRRLARSDDLRGLSLHYNMSRTMTRAISPTLRSQEETVCFQVQQRPFCQRHIDAERWRASLAAPSSMYAAPTSKMFAWPASQTLRKLSADNRRRKYHSNLQPAVRWLDHKIPVSLPQSQYLQAVLDLIMFLLFAMVVTPLGQHQNRRCALGPFY